MGLTISNINALSLLNILSRTTAAQQAVLYRISTGNKINRGADDPAGLMALMTLDSDLSAVDAGITSNQRTDSMLGAPDSARRAWRQPEALSMTRTTRPKVPS